MNDYHHEYCEDSGTGSDDDSCVDLYAVVEGRARQKKDKPRKEVLKPRLSSKSLNQHHAHNRESGISATRNGSSDLRTRSNPNHPEGRRRPAREDVKRPHHQERPHHHGGITSTSSSAMTIKTHTVVPAAPTTRKEKKGPTTTTISNTVVMRRLRREEVAESNAASRSALTHTGIEQGLENLAKMISKEESSYRVLLAKKRSSSAICNSRPPKHQGGADGIQQGETSRRIPRRRSEQEDGIIPMTPHQHLDNKKDPISSRCGPGGRNATDQQDKNDVNIKLIKGMIRSEYYKAISHAAKEKIELQEEGPTRPPPQHHPRFRRSSMNCATNPLLTGSFLNTRRSHSSGSLLVAQREKLFDEAWSIAGNMQAGTTTVLPVSSSTPHPSSFSSGKRISRNSWLGDETNPRRDGRFTTRPRGFFGRFNANRE